jgi:hypothetical protein
VAQLVERFDDGIDDPQQQQVLRREDAIDHVFGEIGPVGSRENGAGADHREPEQQSEPAEERSGDWQRSLQESIRIEQGKTNCQRRPQTAFPLQAFVPLVASEQLRAVGRDVAKQSVGRVQLAQQTDDFFLGRRVVAEVGAGGVPDFLHRPLAVHEPDKIMGGR